MWSLLWLKIYAGGGGGGGEWGARRLGEDLDLGSGRRLE